MAPKKKNSEPSISDREAQLWDVEAKDALDIAEWLELLGDLRRLAEYTPPAELVKVLLKIDRSHLAGVQMRLMEMLYRRLKLEAKSLEHLKQLDHVRRHRCPYTTEQYDAAAAKVGTKQYALAQELGVDRKTLRRHGRPG